MASGISWREVPAYILAQLAGALAGVAAAHLMFGLPVISVSTRVRSGPSQLFSEFVATFGLMAVIWGCARRRPSAVAYAVGATSRIVLVTASTSSPNPAVTIARSLSNTFAGIRPLDVTGFIVAQVAGGFAATLLFKCVIPSFKYSPYRLNIDFPFTFTVFPASNLAAASPSNGQSMNRVHVY